jgi:hypothetical protein
MKGGAVKEVTPRQAVELLNEAFTMDPEALTALTNNRVPCNEALADHPTIQVLDEDGSPKVGLLGILNGIFGADENGQGCLAALYSDDGVQKGFVLTSEFKETT